MHKGVMKRPAYFLIVISVAIDRTKTRQDVSLWKELSRTVCPAFLLSPAFSVRFEDCQRRRASIVDQSFHRRHSCPRSRTSAAPHLSSLNTGQKKIVSSSLSTMILWLACFSATRAARPP